MEAHSLWLQASIEERREEMSWLLDKGIHSLPLCLCFEENGSSHLLEGFENGQAQFRLVNEKKQSLFVWKSPEELYPVRPSSKGSLCVCVEASHEHYGKRFSVVKIEGGMARVRPWKVLYHRKEKLPCIAVGSLVVTK